MSRKWITVFQNLQAGFLVFSEHNIRTLIRKYEIIPHRISSHTPSAETEISSSLWRNFHHWLHDDVIEWKYFPCYWPFVRRITGDRWIPLTKVSDAEFDIFFDVRLDRRLSKQSRRRWFETPSRSLWRQCNVYNHWWKVCRNDDICASVSVTGTNLSTRAPFQYKDRLFQLQSFPL